MAYGDLVQADGETYQVCWDGVLVRTRDEVSVPQQRLPDLTARQRILFAFKLEGEATARRIAEVTGLKIDAVKSMIVKLRAAGLLAQRNSGEVTKLTKTVQMYWLKDEAPLGG